MLKHPLHRPAAVAALLVVLCIGSRPADAQVTVLQGQVVLPSATVSGEVMFSGDTITCAAAQCHPPVGATIIDTHGAYIYPGFVDAHNHVAYNVLPKFTPPQVYTNRSQWQGAPAYKAFKKPYDDLKTTAKLFCEMVKYGEIRALISGITTIEGTSPNAKCFGVLVRNAENQNLLGVPDAHIRTFILDIKSFKGQIDWTKTKSFVVHLAEGTNASAKAEFQTLKQKGLLHKETTIIHGTAFGNAEFAEMGQVGASLVWSPESNLVLYQQTTNIPLALQHGINVSIGVDWNPTGSDTIFDELRVADTVNTTTFNGAIASNEWLPMITSHPAKALALDTMVGSLANGFKADITVVARQDADASVNLLKTHLPDVQMVWIGGQLLYGDKAFVEAVRPNACEPFLIKGIQKRLCIADPTSTVPKHAQTLRTLTNILEQRYPQLAPLTR